MSDDFEADLAARLAAADLGWAALHGDQTANPDYIRFLARQIAAFVPITPPAASTLDTELRERYARAIGWKDATLPALWDDRLDYYRALADAVMAERDTEVQRLRAEAIRHGERATEEFGRAEELMAEVGRLTTALAEEQEATRELAHQHNILFDSGQRLSDEVERLTTDQLVLREQVRKQGEKIAVMSTLLRGLARRVGGFRRVYVELARIAGDTAAERDLAIAHDRQPYPTAWAYEQACAVLHRKEAELAALRAGRDLALWLHAEQTWRYNVVLRDCAEAQTAEDVAIEEGRGYLTRSRELASQLAALRAQQQDMVRYRLAWESAKRRARGHWEAATWIRDERDAAERQRE